MKDNDSKFLILERGKHYTLTTLATYLNEKHGRKKSGEQFNAGDIQKYLTRGHLPMYLGGFVLKSVFDEVMGVKVVAIGDPVETNK